MEPKHLSAAIAVVALCSAPALAQGGCTDPLLWDNGAPDGSTGYSNTIATCWAGVDRTLLDDFEVADPGWDLVCFEWHHVWASGAGAGFATGARFDIRANTANDTPGALIKPLSITSYRDVATGTTWFSRPEVVSTIHFDPCDLDPGKYWIEGAICGNDNNFWVMHEPFLCSETWVDYEDLNYFGPGSGMGGPAYGMSYRLYGNEHVDRIVEYCHPADGHANNTSGIDVSGNSLGQGIEICLTGGPPGQFGYLLIGDSNGIVHQPPGSKGDLCIVGGSCVGRYAKDIAVIDTAGSLCADIRNSASGGPGYGIPTCGGKIQPGETWYFQYWHRQPQGQPSTFSEAAGVTFEP